MAIQFKCPNCTAVIRVPDDAAGTKIICWQCAAKVFVPLVSKAVASEADLRTQIDLAKIIPCAPTFNDFYDDDVGVRKALTGLLIFAVILTIVAIGTANSGPEWLFCAVGWGFFAMMYVIFYAGCREQSRSKALSDSSDLRALARSHLSSLDVLVNLLDTANNHIDNAIRDFEANAFGPFWDSVQEAVRALDAFRCSAKSASQSHEDYHSRLVGLNHTFPALPAFVDRLPNPLPTLRRLSEIVRKGQTDFHFATIWEQRRTREALIAGFNSWAEALSQIESQVVAAFRAIGWSAR
jgi:hypothetical protein